MDSSSEAAVVVDSCTVLSGDEVKPAAMLKIAIIGQSLFGAEVYRLLRSLEHRIVGVFTVPDVKGRPDPLAQAAEADGVKVFKIARWRNRGQVLDEVLEQYKSVGAELNVLPFCSQFIPMEVIRHPKFQSICYHPSLLPRHRGASAINWTLIQGDETAGLSVFWADDGLDTGPILLQRECRVEPNDTVDSLYSRFLYPEGIKAMGQAVQLVASGDAPKIQQTEEGATYDPIMKTENAQIKWTWTAQVLHNFIRGNEKVPGAWAVINGEKLTLFGSRLWSGALPKPKLELDIENSDRKAIIHSTGMLLLDEFGSAVNVDKIRLESGKTLAASKYGQSSEASSTMDYNEAEMEAIGMLKSMWIRILNTTEIDESSDFFKMGAGSMDVVRLVAEVQTLFNDIQLRNDDVYMASGFEDFAEMVIMMCRGTYRKEEFHYEAIEKETKRMKVRLAHQLFINNEYVNASDGGTFDVVSPVDESVICAVANGTAEDADKAVEAASKAFLDGEWSRMNARDRGRLMYKLADLMESNKEELAVIESLDSGAVFTLALKTHIGMSIDALRYFAGWCDKIQGKTIPINHARPNKNFTYTKREPIGVCGIITPWNYPLMMLSWKLSACIATGNTVVLKPAQVTPLSSLKFGELAVKAGFPPGVINVVTGSGSVVGQAIARHPKIRKIGFTGSTPVGKTIMESCAQSNLKKVSLELGGKSPLIVFSDCDIEKAVRFACSAVFFNKGENCIAAGRIFVERSIHDQFVNKVLAEISKMKIGDPLEVDTDHGPQNHRIHLEKLLSFCGHGVKEGAVLLCGGKQVERPGLFMHPTVFTDVTDDMFIAKEESFGPVMIISKFDDGDVEGVIRRANDTEYGLASGVFTRDISRALLVSDKLNAGTVFINTYNKTDVAAPFGGFRQSGFGKDLGEEALNEYLQTKTVTIEY